MHQCIYIISQTTTTVGNDLQQCKGSISRLVTDIFILFVYRIKWNETQWVYAILGDLHHIRIVQAELQPITNTIHICVFERIINTACECFVCGWVIVASLSLKSKLSIILLCCLYLLVDSAYFIYYCRQTDTCKIII